MGPPMTSIASCSAWAYPKLGNGKLLLASRFNYLLSTKVTDSGFGHTKLTPSALVGNFAVQTKYKPIYPTSFASINTGLGFPNIMI